MTKEELEYIIERLIIAHNNHSVLVQFRRRDAVRFYLGSVAATFTFYAVVNSAKKMKKAWKEFKEEADEFINVDSKENHEQGT